MRESKVMLYPVVDLHDLYKDGRIRLAPEFQRNSIWPTAARAYLIDTILNRQPIPQLFLHRVLSAQTGRTTYDVVDGQQRLRAMFDFLEDKLRLTQSSSEPFYKKSFSELSDALKKRVLEHTIVVQELSGYSQDEIEDMFVRINRFVVPLSKQELRHAKAKGRFHEFAKRVGGLPFWSAHNVFSKHQIARMRHEEFVAELAILLIEGPQDKKKAVDLYYIQYQDKFPGEAGIEARLKGYLKWIEEGFPDLKRHRFRKAVDLYALVGALDQMAGSDGRLSVKAAEARVSLTKFERTIEAKAPGPDARAYLAAASRQTDNVVPRQERIDVLRRILRAA